MKSLIFSAFVALVMLGLYSCEKTDSLDGTVTLEDNLKAAVSDVISTKMDVVSTQDIQSSSVDTYKGLNGAILDNTLKSGGLMHFKIPHLSKCATVTVSDSVYPKEIIIDYGTECSDGHHHSISGKIIINISDSLTKAGAIKTVLYQDVYIDSMKIEYNASYKNLGKNAEGNWVIESSSDQIVTLADGTVISNHDNETTTWLDGYGTTAKEDDKFYKSGSGTININDSLTYSRKITTPLLYDRSCDYILSGVVELYTKGNTVVIDYGNGTCDNVATVTTNGTTEEISLDSHEFGQYGLFRKHCSGFGHHGGKHGNH
jgi:hypothetical protein